MKIQAMGNRGRVPSGEGRRVAVFGAYGHTGRFVVDELLRRNFVPVAIGRDGRRLAAAGFAERGVAMVQATADDAASLDRAFEDVVAVINCAGPFLDTAKAVASAAMRSRIHYLDVTAEQASAQDTFDSFDTASREAGVVVLPAMGFYGGLGDLLATAAAGDWEAVDEIRIGIALDSWHPTQGTRVTGTRNTFRRQVIAGGQLSPLPHPPEQTSWAFAEPFGEQDVVELPFSEVVLVERHLRTTELHTYLNLAPLRDLRDASTPAPQPSDVSGRSAQRFLVHATARSGHQMRHAMASGRDIYAVSAPLVCEAVQRILDGAGGGAGAYAPGEMFEPASFLEALAPTHLNFEVGRSLHALRA